MPIPSSRRTKHLPPRPSKAEAKINHINPGISFPTFSILMNTSTLQIIVDAAIAADREVTALNERLKRLKSDLITEGRRNTDQLTATDGGGKSWIAKGSDGSIARVTFPGDSLESKIEGQALEEAQELSGKLFYRLFRPTVVYSPVADFRKEAALLLGDEKGRLLIKLCERTSAPRVGFEIALREAISEPCQKVSP